MVGDPAGRRGPHGPHLPRTGGRHRHRPGRREGLRGAPHAFFSDDRPQTYEKEAAEDAWKRCIAFLDRHLKA
jgi:dienelactone hydrolase